MVKFVQMKLYGVTEDGTHILKSTVDFDSECSDLVAKEDGWMGDLETIFDGESCMKSTDLVEKCVAFWGRSAPIVYKRLKGLDLIKTRDGNTIWYSLGENAEEIGEAIPDFVKESKWSKNQLRELDAYNLTYGKELTEDDADGLRVLEGEWNYISELEEADEGPMDFDSCDEAVQDAVNAFLGGEDSE